MIIQTPYVAPPCAVLPDWIDHNGHMNVGYYLVAFDNASETFFHFLGFTPEFRRENHATTFSLENHLHHVREVTSGDPLRFEFRLIDANEKRFHFYVEMLHATSGHIVATHEGISAHVDTRTRRTALMADALIQRMQAVKAAHAVLPRPWRVGHVMSVNAPKHWRESPSEANDGPEPHGTNQDPDEATRRST